MKEMGRFEMEVPEGGQLPFVFKPFERCDTLRTFFPGVENGVRPTAEQMAAGWKHVNECPACLRNTIRQVAIQTGNIMLPIQLSKKQAAKLAKMQGMKVPEGAKAN